MHKVKCNNKKLVLTASTLLRHPVILSNEILIAITKNQSQSSLSLEKVIRKTNILDFPMHFWFFFPTCSWGGGCIEQKDLRIHCLEHSIVLSSTLNLILHLIPYHIKEQQRERTQKPIIWKDWLFWEWLTVSWALSFLLISSDLPNLT